MYVGFQFKYRLLFNKARKGGVKEVRNEKKARRCGEVNVG
jgi:hypothetical protein